MDDHVGLCRHMAVDALRAGTAGSVMVMLSDVEFWRHVALSAQPIAIGAQLESVRVMAIGTDNACVMHTALHERAVFEHLAVDLPVGMIQPGLEEAGKIEVEERRARRRT